MTEQFPVLAKYLLSNPHAVKPRNARYFTESSSATSMICFVCSVNHPSSICPYKRCFRCAQIVHDSDTCSAELACNFCRSAGHSGALACPTQVYNRGLNPDLHCTVSCVACGDRGHVLCYRSKRTLVDLSDSDDIDFSKAAVCRTKDSSLLKYMSKRPRPDDRHNSRHHSHKRAR